MKFHLKCYGWAFTSVVLQQLEGEVEAGRKRRQLEAEAAQKVI